MPGPLREAQTRNVRELRVVIPDSEFGEFALTPACSLDLRDIQVTDPARGWRRVTYDELVWAIHALLAAVGK